MTRRNSTASSMTTAGAIAIVTVEQGGKTLSAAIRRVTADNHPYGGSLVWNRLM